MTKPWAKCCHLCGRWGTLQFDPLPDGRDGYLCSNDRACAARLRRGKPVWTR